MPHNGVHAAPENLDHCGATPPKVPNQGGGGAQEFSNRFAWRKSGSTLPLRAERGNQKREVRPESGDMPQETLMRPRGRRSRYTTDTPAAQTKRKHQLKAYPKGGAGSGSGWGWLRRGVDRRKKQKKRVGVKKRAISPRIMGRNECFIKKHQIPSPPQAPQNYHDFGPKFGKNHRETTTWILCPKCCTCDVLAQRGRIFIARIGGKIVLGVCGSRFNIDAKRFHFFAFVRMCVRLCVCYTRVGGAR